MVGRITALTLLVALACKQGQVRIPELSAPRNTLSYSQYHSLEKGMTSRAILNAFGKPLHTLEQEGKVRGLTYWCEDATGQAQHLKMVFSEAGRLEEWALVGPERAKSAS